MGGHSTSDDPSRYVEKHVMDEWAQKDPIRRFQEYLVAEGILDDAAVAKVAEEAEADITAAIRASEKKARPSLETIFTDVFEQLPPHLAHQRDDCIDHHASRGEEVDEKGEFPL